MQKEILKQNKLASDATVNSVSMLELINENNELKQECANLHRLKVIKESLSYYFDKVVKMTADEKTVKIFELQRENDDLRLAVYSILGGIKADEFFENYELFQQQYIRDDHNLKAAMIKAMSYKPPMHKSQAALSKGIQALNARLRGNYDK